ncbi:PilZ domain-containing protein [Sphingomonas sp. PR090111-T3T-6A]|uniref:PilZ domain-containing protein n=1 Tax=Sphingomonas sp. PR090111-T3T-6A TaxID=685778 RepID=UPI00138AD3F6|nr:PilZ domain-containing protein [Sphingomonas sp. PR090111-T3T-6A]
MLIQARMRMGASWSDIVIHNISSRGMMVRTEQPPEPGTYVEIRHGMQTIVGRAVWRTVRNFGIRTQDRIDMEALASGQDSPAAQRPAPSDQRAAPDVAFRATRSRQTSALLQYILIGVVGLTAAGFAAREVYVLLTRPLATVTSHLSNGG